MAVVIAILVALTAALTVGWAHSGQGSDGANPSQPVVSKSDPGQGRGQSDGAGEVDSIEAIAEELAKGQARDRAQLNGELAQAAEGAHARLSQILQELTLAVGAHETGEAGSGASEEWRQGLGHALSALKSVEEGTSDQAVAREAFIGAAHLLQAAVTDYELLLAGSGDERAALAESTIMRRDAAVRLWQAGAGQLDTLTVESGEGHVHLFLAPDGDPDAVPLEFREPGESTH